MAWRVAGAATVLIALAAAGAHAQQGTAPAWGRGYWDGPWHGWFMGPLMMLVFLALVALLVVLIVRWTGARAGFSETSHDGGRPSTPLDILKERFARGEIDKTEYEERRKVLKE